MPDNTERIAQLRGKLEQIYKKVNDSDKTDKINQIKDKKETFNYGPISKGK